MTTMDLHVSPLGQVEGDLDVKVTITDGDCSPPVRFTADVPGINIRSLNSDGNTSMNIFNVEGLNGVSQEFFTVNKLANTVVGLNRTLTVTGNTVVKVYASCCSSGLASYSGGVVNLAGTAAAPIVSVGLPRTLRLGLEAYRH